MDRVFGQSEETVRKQRRRNRIASYALYAPAGLLFAAFFLFILLMHWGAGFGSLTVVLLPFLLLGVLLFFAVYKWRQFSIDTQASGPKQLRLSDREMEHSDEVRKVVIEFDKIKKIQVFRTLGGSISRIGLVVEGQANLILDHFDDMEEIAALVTNATSARVEEDSASKRLPMALAFGCLTIVLFELADDARLHESTVNAIGLVILYLIARRMQNSAL